MSLIDSHITHRPSASSGFRYDVASNQTWRGSKQISRASVIYFAVEACCYDMFDSLEQCVLLWTVFLWCSLGAAECLFIHHSSLISFFFSCFWIFFPFQHISTHGSLSPEASRAVFKIRLTLVGAINHVNPMFRWFIMGRGEEREKEKSSQTYDC